MAIELTVLIAVLGFIISYQSYQMNRQKDAKTDTRQNARIETQLGHIGKGVDDIRIDLKANEKEIGRLGERVTRVEESARSAHKRIDRLTGEDKK
ncbi:hypothetical protein JYK21_01185 [Ralstonia pickettii]|nr:hypothetical protein [Ralstonia pickettii]